MSLLDNLWDDTVAGPRPSGLNKLRRSNSSPPESGSEPSSPASAPGSPRTPTTPRGNWWRLRRKLAGPGPGADPAEPWKNPTVYDWVVISALDV